MNSACFLGVAAMRCLIKRFEKKNRRAEFRSKDEGRREDGEGGTKAQTLSKDLYWR